MLPRKATFRSINNLRCAQQKAYIVNEKAI